MNNSPINTDSTRVQAAGFQACLRPLALSHPVCTTRMLLTLVLSRKLCQLAK